MSYNVRKNCIFCNCYLSSKYFNNDLEIQVAQYCTDENCGMLIPYNVSICPDCNTVQILYLGPLDIIYKNNHVDNTSIILREMHGEFKKIIDKYSDSVQNILEIGSSNGFLCDIIIADYKNLVYNIIEPSYHGDCENRVIIKDFYENIDDSIIDFNTIIMSHVFEHFYEPLKIIEKIKNNKNITKIFLSHPDLEYYLENNVFHVLNTEHTYYIYNSFLVDLFNNYGFVLKDKSSFREHSVFFYFERTSEIVQKKLLNDKVKIKIDNFFGGIYKIVDKFNNIIDNNNKVYLFPCSIHSTFLFSFGLHIDKLEALLDNSTKKIDKHIYGYNLLCKSFKKIAEDGNNKIILLSGGNNCKHYNEIIESLKLHSVKYVLP